jgi:Zn-dependent protease with chaperone function
MRDFFRQQEHARKQTRLLVLLMCLAVAAIVAMVNVIAAVTWHWVHERVWGGALPDGFFITNSLITVGLIAGGTIVELFNLNDGGDAVARMAGGRLVSVSSQDPQERRLQNVVAEMAIASGLACPKVYVLDKEESINAFAAGYNPNEAVVAVTRGMLARLTRDELQGVIAHEFSHILNGDMRLNMRLIGVLFGIEMVAGLGRKLIRLGGTLLAPRNDSPKGNLVGAFAFSALGVSLYVVGYAGVFMGRLIKAAISRQREFLADASAVQFTRSPDGIGGALRKIGSLTLKGGAESRISNPNSDHLSHFYIGAPATRLMTGWLATHPPITERLRRLYGQHVELLDAPVLPEASTTSPSLPDIPYQVASFTSGLDKFPGHIAEVSIAGESDSSLHRFELPPALDSALRDPAAAHAVAFAVLLHKADRKKAEVLVRAHAPSQAELVTYLLNLLDALPNGLRLTVLDLAMPALKQNSLETREELLLEIGRIIKADDKITLDEFVVQCILARRLGSQAGRAIKIRHANAAAIRKECALLFSLVAIVAAKDRPTREAFLAQFIQSADFLPELELTASDFVTAASIDFAKVRQALDQANSMMPLAKPALIKALVAGSEREGALSIESADILRAICSAIDVPLPPVVSAHYADSTVLEPA